MLKTVQKPEIHVPEGIMCAELAFRAKSGTALELLQRDQIFAEAFLLCFVLSHRKNFEECTSQKLRKFDREIPEIMLKR